MHWVCRVNFDIIVFMAGIPKSLQSVLWSRDVNSLDLEGDKIYIINQVLSYGTMEQLAWLFNQYSKDEVERIFREKPMKIYAPSAYNWLVTTVFNDSGASFLPSRYVKTLPRNIRS